MGQEDRRMVELSLIVTGEYLSTEWYVKPTGRDQVTDAYGLDVHPATLKFDHDRFATSLEAKLHACLCLVLNPSVNCVITFHNYT